MASDLYRQCELIKPVPPSWCVQVVTWLPEKYATEGEVVQLRNRGQWDDGYVVRRVFGDGLPWDAIPDPPRDFRAHKKRTGDSEPKRA